MTEVALFRGHMLPGWALMPVLFTVLLGCGDNLHEAIPEVAPDAAPEVAPDAALDAAIEVVPPGMTLVRQTPWPGSGRELLVRIEPNDSSVADFTSALQLYDANNTVTPVNAAPIALRPGYTSLVIRSKPAVDTDLETALHAFIDSRPAGERIALVRWGMSMDQVTNFTSDRRRLHAQLPRALKGNFGDKLEASAALATAVDQVETIGGPFEPVMRSVVVLANDQDQPMPHGPTPVLVAHDAATLTAAGAKIDAWAASSHYTVGLCGPDRAAPARLVLTDLDSSLDIILKEPLSETAALSCDPQAIGPGLRTYSDVVEFQFTSAERTVYDNRLATLSKDDFSLSVIMEDGAQPVLATAHLHGQGSLVICARKSYTLNLTGPRRHLLADSYTEEFYLIAMCLDDRYIQQFTANQLMQEYGYFPLKSRFVELIIDGQTRGVYLLLEKTKEELILDNTRVRSVLRRGSVTGPDDVFDVKHSDFGDAAAIDAVRAIHEPAAYLSGNTLVAALRERFDFDGYLGFLALMSAYQNGDYIDEVWFYSTETVRSDGSVGDYFSFMGWDNDDIFSDCHGWGVNAIVDPWGLLYCSESQLSKAMFRDPYIYELFVDKLEERLAVVNEARFNQAVDYTATKLLPFFARAEICAAMTNLLAANPAATDPVVATADIQAHLDALKVNFKTRRDLLLARIAAYRAAQTSN